MKTYSIIFFICFCASSMFAQKYFTKEGHISFYSDAPLEKIEAHNHKASSVLDAATGNIQWAVLIKAFEFEKALMQEHFNENYMESSKFPKAKFSGQILNMNELSLDSPGQYTAQIKGQLEIHGVTKDISSQATFVVTKEGIAAKSKLGVLVADYNIEIPAVVKENIAKEVIIEIEANYQVLDKS